MLLKVQEFLTSKPSAGELQRFLDLQMELVEDLNFKISLTALQIIHKTVLHCEAPQLATRTEQLVHVNTKKLGDSKIVIRQAAAENLIALMQVIRLYNERLI